MIALDTHIWYWWVHTPDLLSATQRKAIDAHAGDIVGISAISCWEVAKRVEYGKMQLARPLEEWMTLALRFPGVHLLPLTPQIAVASTRLPGPFHKDPADQIIVATARVHGCRLLTADRKILDYPFVDTLA